MLPLPDLEPHDGIAPLRVSDVLLLSLSANLKVSVAKTLGGIRCSGVSMEVRCALPDLRASGRSPETDS